MLRIKISSDKFVRESSVKQAERRGSEETLERLQKARPHLELRSKRWMRTGGCWTTSVRRPVLPLPSAVLYGSERF